MATAASSLHQTLSNVKDFENLVKFSMKTQPDGSRKISLGHDFPLGTIGPGALSIEASYTVKLPGALESGLEMAEGLGVDLGNSPNSQLINSSI